MQKPASVFFTSAAKLTGIPLDELRSAALNVVEPHQGQEIWFQTFRVRGRQFAISTRLIVEVDYFPHRAPATILSRPVSAARLPRHKT